MTIQFQRNAPPAVDNHKRRQPSKQTRRRVRNAFDPEMLAHICTTWDFSDYASRVELDDSTEDHPRFFYYKDNGSDVLAIAHLDSVQADGTCTIMGTRAGLLAVSGTLDDRLGAYVILELLPRLGITCDWLLTTDEEIGQSTAEDFLPQHKSYNWMFQFDRGGTDVVMYDYETSALIELVEDAGARVGLGSFSDICLLEHLGIAGFNWGVGYQDYHGPRSHAWLDDTFRMVARFVKFHTANSGTVLAHTLRPRYNWDDRDDAWVERDLIVADCGHHVDLDDDTTYVESGGGMVIDCIDCAPGDVTYNVA